MLALALAAITFPLHDTSGARHDVSEIASSRAAVFVFLSATCPLSSRYAPDLQQLHATYAERGVRFFAVLTDPSMTPQAASRYAAEYNYRFPLLLDRRLSLARQMGARTTPEAVLVAPDLRILYKGRIDDRAAAPGRLRAQITRHDLREALDETLAGKPVSIAAAPATGCAIPFPPSKQDTTVTFSKHIAAILFRHCAPCHRPGQTAPFPLLTYADAAPRAATIAAVTAARTMPPWKAAPQALRFQHERRLRASEIALLRRWADNGAPQGNTALAPPTPTFNDAPPLGTPDLAVTMTEPFEVPAGGDDIYRCFVIPTSLPADQWVRAIDFQPSNRAALHHALVFADSSGAARRHAFADPSKNSYPCFGIPGFLPTASYGGWSPGMTALPYPEGAAFRLPKGADIVVQLHYHPTGKPETDRSSVLFYFTNKAPTRRLMDVALGSRRIDIPAGEARYRITDYFTLPIDLWLTGVIPHAHYICREMRGWAILPDRRKLALIKIPDWDFAWQHQYRYVKPVRLPAGTRLDMESAYVNS